MIASCIKVSCDKQEERLISSNESETDSWNCDESPRDSCVLIKSFGNCSGEANSSEVTLNLLNLISSAHSNLSTSVDLHINFSLSFSGTILSSISSGQKRQAVDSSRLRNSEENDMKTNDKNSFENSKGGIQGMQNNKSLSLDKFIPESAQKHHPSP
jgi:hypothetical protein